MVVLITIFPCDTNYTETLSTLALIEPALMGFSLLCWPRRLLSAQAAATPSWPILLQSSAGHFKIVHVKHLGLEKLGALSTIWDLQVQ